MELEEKDIRRIFQPGRIFGYKAFQKLIDFIKVSISKASVFNTYINYGGTKSENEFKYSFIESIDNSVLTSEQNLSDAEKQQARINIGAASEETIGNINEILDTINGEVI